MRPTDRLGGGHIALHNAVIWAMVSVCLLFVLKTAGCGPYDIPPPGASHPANPQAEIAPAMRMSEVLEIDRENLPQMPPEMKRAEMRDNHQDH